MNFRPFLCLIGFLLLISCGKKEKKVVVTPKDNDGTVEYCQVAEADSTLKDGWCFTISSNGDTLEKSSYSGGMLHGERILFHPNGIVEAIENYAQNTMVGVYKAFYEDGSPSVEGQYLNGEMDGVWKFFYKTPSGALKEEVTFKSNMENGPFREFHPNGKIAAEGTYKDEFEDGQLKVFDSTGTLNKIYVFENGRPVETINVQ